MGFDLSSLHYSCFLLLLLALAYKQCSSGVALHRRPSSQTRDEWFPGVYPMVPGHEVVGVVTRLTGQKGARLSENPFPR